MKHNTKSIMLTVLFSLLLPFVVSAEKLPHRDVLTLERAVAIAKERSPRAQTARYTLLRHYWNYRSYKAELLPALNLSGTALNYNQSTVDVRDATTGEVNYVKNNTLSNSATLSIDQNIPVIGGTLSIESYLSNLQQFDYGKNTFNTNPVSINYRQPLRTYNALNWDRKTAPKEFEQARRVYLETLQTIAMTTTSLFFTALAAQSAYEKAVQTYEDRKALFESSQRRLELLGTVSRSELLQLELSMLNAEMSVNSTKLTMESELFALNLYLGTAGFTEIELVAPFDVPTVLISEEMVLSKARENSSHSLELELKELASEEALAKAKSARGIQATLNANLGLSQTGSTFSEAYKNPEQRIVVGVAFSLPIYDWGLAKGKVMMAETDMAVTNTELEQSELEFVEDIHTKVARFNNQQRQCEISRRARLIAEERYAIVKGRFEGGNVTVTELNTAQDEYDQAVSRDISQLNTFWSSYYELQKLTLYNFMLGMDVSEDFDKIFNGEK